MIYQVALADSAKADANHIYEWIIIRAPRRGAKEANRKVRCLLFGKRRHVYRILYEVDEQRQMVWILHIRHGARQDRGSDELSRSPGYA